MDLIQQIEPSGKQLNTSKEEKPINPIRGGGGSNSTQALLDQLSHFIAFIDLFETF